MPNLAFEPVLGEIYFLYRKKNGDVWLSLIAPNECTWDYVGTFRLNSAKMWEQIEQEN